MLVAGTIRLPAALDDWCHAAANLPLGRDEKLFLEVVGSSPFQPETHVIGDPRDPRTGTYYIRPLGRPVIESFFGGEGALGWRREAPWTASRTPSTSSRRFSAPMSGACFARWRLRTGVGWSILGAPTAMPFQGRQRHGMRSPVLRSAAVLRRRGDTPSRLHDRPWRLPERGTRSRRSAGSAQAARGVGAVTPSCTSGNSIRGRPFSNRARSAPDQPHAGTGQVNEAIR